MSLIATVMLIAATATSALAADYRVTDERGKQKAVVSRTRDSQVVITDNRGKIVGRVDSTGRVTDSRGKTVGFADGKE